MSNALLYKVAYDEAVRALSEQQAVIDSFRTRGGMLLSAAAVTTSFLGAQALQGGASSFTGWLALTAFVGVAAVSLALLWPYEWQVTMDPLEIVSMFIEAERPAPIEAMYRELAEHMHVSYLQNREGVNLLVVLFQVASGLLALEITFWTVAIAATP
jgi:hypothetical protein